LFAPFLKKPQGFFYSFYHLFNLCKVVLELLVISI
jgi:hypothetical protein